MVSRSMSTISHCITPDYTDIIQIINTLRCPTSKSVQVASLQLSSAHLLVLNLLHAAIEVGGPSAEVGQPVGHDSSQRGESGVQRLNDLASLAVGNVVDNDLGQSLGLNDGSKELGGSGQIGKQTGVHLTGAHKGSSDLASKTSLVGDGVMQTDHGMLGRGVGRHVAGSNETDGGGDRHDPSSLVLEEVGDDGLQGPEVRDNVDLEQVSNELLVEVLDSLLAHHTGVVDQNGDGTHVSLHLGEGLVNDGLVSEVTVVVGGTGQGSGGLLSVENGTSHASLGQLIGNVMSETVGASGDDRNISGSQLPALDLQVSSRDDSEEVEDGGEDASASNASESGQVLVKVTILVRQGQGGACKQRVEQDLVCELDNVVNVQRGLGLEKLFFVSEFRHF